MTSSTIKTSQLGTYVIIDTIKTTPFATVHIAKSTHTHAQNTFLIHEINSHLSDKEQFVFRFELLRNAIPFLRQPHLIPIIEVQVHNNIYYIVKQYPLLEKTQLPISLLDFLKKFSPQSISNLAHIIEQIILGLYELESTPLLFTPQGIILDSLSLDDIYIKIEKETSSLKILLDNYLESFLFFGDAPTDTLKYFFERSFDSWQKGKSQSPYEEQSSYPPQARQGHNLSYHHHIYALGHLIQEILTYAKSSNNHSPYIASTFSRLNELARKCQKSEEKPFFSSCADILQFFKEKIIPDPQETPHKTSSSINNVATAPSGMSLIAFDEKPFLGSNEYDLNETPLFKASIPPFYLDKKAVSCAEFEKFYPQYQRHPLSKYDSSPAVNISWHLAQKYCEWKSEQEGLPHNTYRLPTEYEWEAAARGGHLEQQLDPENLSFSLHVEKSKERGPCNVNDGTPSYFQLHHMLGNIWEWTSSSFKPHPHSKSSLNKFNTNMKVCKGGCWITPFEDIRSSLRKGFYPNETHPFLGFRCARSYVSPNS